MHTETKLDQGKDPVAGVDLPILSEIRGDQFVGGRRRSLDWP